MRNCESFAFTLLCFCNRVTPILTASTLPDCPFHYLLPCRNHGRPIREHSGCSIDVRTRNLTGSKRGLKSLLFYLTTYDLSQNALWWTCPDLNRVLEYFSVPTLRCSSIYYILVFVMCQLFSANF